jgi:hypothetical protein
VNELENEGKKKLEKERERALERQREIERAREREKESERESDREKESDKEKENKRERERESIKREKRDHQECWGKTTPRLSTVTNLKNGSGIPCISRTWRKRKRSEGT